ncbi:hypothetical protein LTR78_006982 [Recurvomyces mirabilis]|uniref:Uncharacterized protein n=1 Tax=Recurvomyces mirabilis TaxID=574656 RepID=A0AAE0WK32_9PEZI|nr:hypothetical protein LTR78_006982 [Recurvomyces mirabilis]KAK5153366.1 hypothetical protein LTS14_007535 [Recurvomyces mirabilis]
MDHEKTPVAQGYGDQHVKHPVAYEAQQPDRPPRQTYHDSTSAPGQYAGGSQTMTLQPPPPLPHRLSVDQQQDISSPIHYTRDPHRLVAYLVPFPRPQNAPVGTYPTRFLIYTPPPPPLSKPAEGEKETKIHKVQRKWQDEVKEAKTSTAKTMSWKGVKSKATKGISWGMCQTKTSSLEFLNRIGAGEQTQQDNHAEDGHNETEQTKATVKLEEMLLVYPASMPGDSTQIREEFVNTMMRSKSKAERDAVIATGLMPVAAAIDILVTIIWPFGGLLEVDAVWAYASIRGAKTSRSVTKRLTSTSTTGKHEEDKLHLNFTPSPRLEVLERYLAARCHERDGTHFSYVASAPTETEVLEAIGWFPSSKGGAEQNWEDEQWEIMEVKDDFKQVMGKGAKEWSKWCTLYDKTPEKALKK